MKPEHDRITLYDPAAELRAERQSAAAACRKSRRRQWPRWVRPLLVRVLPAVLLVGLLGGGAWGVWRWATYPTVPDPAAEDLDEVIAFIGADDFNQMLQSHRRQYVLAVVGRLKEMSFMELLGVMTKRDERRRNIASNVRNMDARDEIGAAVTAMFFDKYYELSPWQRDLALRFIVYAQEGEIADHPERFGLPKPDQFKRQMTRFMTRQPPKVQAQAGQFLIDLSKKRESMGVGDPSAKAADVLRKRERGSGGSEGD